MDAVETRRMIVAEGTGAVGEEVDAEVKVAAGEMGIKAVPAYTVQGRYRIGGYQPPQVFESVFEKARASAMTVISTSGSGTKMDLT
jgi:predicted DsbA family dithiol-disulfide isomerase